MKLDEIENRIEELENEIKYEENKLGVCGYGKSDLMYIESLKCELGELEEQLKEQLEEMEE